MHAQKQPFFGFGWMGYANLSKSDQCLIFVESMSTKGKRGLTFNSDSELMQLHVWLCGAEVPKQFCIFSRTLKAKILSPFSVLEAKLTAVLNIFYHDFINKEVKAVGLKSF